MHICLSTGANIEVYYPPFRTPDIMSLDKEQDLIPVRMFTQFAYCNRLSYMEWVQGEFAYNAEVAEGKYLHRNVDVTSGNKKLTDGNEHETIHARSVTVSDATLGLIAKIDLLEIHGNKVVPVEYKRGKAPDIPDGAHEDHLTQLCSQAMLLHANGYECDTGIVYYISSKQRIEIKIDDNLIAKTAKLLNQMRDMMKQGVIPPPLVDSPKCPRCSLVGICMPDETNLLSDKNLSVRKDNVRRMYPIRNDAIPVHVQEQGAKVTLSGECIHIKPRDGKTKKVRIIDISEVTVFGNVQITTNAIRKMCDQGIPICYMSYGGWFVGVTSGASSKNIDLRIKQYKAHLEKSSAISIARQIVWGKIKNSMTMLRRNHKGVPVSTMRDLDRMAAKVSSVKRYDVLLGLEGMAARIYFSEFSGMIKNNSGNFDFTQRNRRPPKDPVNAILSFLYSMLARQAVTIATTVGFDPYLGFLHMPKYGKPALALDMIEEFRSIVADSTCITLINNSQITKNDMIITDFGTNLTETGRRKVIEAYERRMDSAVTHRLLGYSVSYRRIMETQMRLLSRHLLGEIPMYPPFRTR